MGNKAVKDIWLKLTPKELIASFTAPSAYQILAQLGGIVFEEMKSRIESVPGVWSKKLLARVSA